MSKMATAVGQDKDMRQESLRPVPGRNVPVAESG